MGTTIKSRQRRPEWTAVGLGGTPCPALPWPREAHSEAQSRHCSDKLEYDLWICALKKKIFYFNKFQKLGSIFLISDAVS